MIPNSQTIPIDIVDMDALVSTDLLTKWLLIFTRRWKALLQWLLWTLILHIIFGPSTLVKLINFNPSSLFFFGQFNQVFQGLQFSWYIQNGFHGKSSLL
jgi:hypothetical protein